MSPDISLREAALRVVQRLREHGHEALWAGGCVRDMLLGRPPSDIDVATSARPEELIRLFRRTRKVGVQFGVVLVRQGPWWIETATFRQDVNYEDGRRPERVIFTSAEEDARRRDFTINGLFYDPLHEQVIDYVGGQDDLKAGVVRAIGNPADRFAEDHLRMLRAVRFTARLGFQLDPATGQAIREHADRLVRISAERIREELDRMLSVPSRPRAFLLMAELGLLPYLWPESHWTPEGMARSAAVLQAMDPGVDFIAGLAAMLCDRSPAEVGRIARALRCSNQEREHLAWLVANHARLSDVRHPSLAEFKRLLAHPRFEDLLSLDRAVCLATGRPSTAQDWAIRLRQEIRPELIAPPPFVTGEDLIERGFSPGPLFKRLLDTLYEAQLNEELTSREAALARLAQLSAASGPDRPAHDR